MATLWFADRVIQRPMPHVIEPRAIVDAAARDCVPALHELGKECVALPAAVGDASEARVLTRDAHAGVPHYEVEEPRVWRSVNPNSAMARTRSSAVSPTVPPPVRRSVRRPCHRRGAH